jgi:hypothetical protein
MDKILNAVGAARAARIDLLIVFAMGLAPGWHAAAEAAQQQVGPDPAKLAAVVGPAMAFLDKAQADDGSFSKDEGLGVTALVATAMLRQGRSTSDPTVARALKYLEALVNDDGGVYSQDSLHKNYETSVAIVCFNEANHDGRYDEQLRNAERFVKSLQWDESEGFDKSSDNYGGAGYGSHSRPDLSNTSFLIDALHAVGRDADDPALQKALVFVSRCQNLATSENATAYADKVNDGGFYYTIAAGGSSQDLRRPEKHDLRRRRTGRSAREGRPAVDRRSLRLGREPRHGHHRPVLLLSHLRQGTRCHGRRPGDRRRRHQTRLAPRAIRPASQHPARERQLGQQ